MVPTCPENVSCTDGVALEDRLYYFTCRPVDPEAVTEDVIGTGQDIVTEARGVRGLPADLWMAAKGDLPCRPSAFAPLEHEWYLVEFGDIEFEELQEYAEAVNDIVIEP